MSRTPRTPNDTKIIQNLIEDSGVRDVQIFGDNNTFRSDKSKLKFQQYQKEYKSTDTRISGNLFNFKFW